MWSDLGEIRTIAVHPKSGQGVGTAIVDRLLDMAEDLHLERIFVLTFEVEFFPGGTASRRSKVRR